ncbi:MAG TPA: DUF4097 family beta strand repeat-containing protein [Actinomycetes bacterium]|nr:DUF4097 family beta strand repeat-containing protein [Actinomycetes bacterium]
MTATLTPPAPAGRPPRQHGPGAPLVVLAGLLLAVLAIASGSLTLASLLWLRSQTTHESLAAAGTVEVHQPCGGIRVTEGPQTSISLTTKSWMTFDRPTVTADRVGGRLVVRSHCSALTLGGISGSTSVALVVPAGTALDLSSSGGGIDLVGVSGTVVAHSSAGGVFGDGLRAASVTASSSAGSLDLRFSAPPSTVTATSSAGSVTVAVPDDGTAYAVDAHSSAGSATVDIATDPKAARSITAQSSAGSVHVGWT